MKSTANNKRNGWLGGLARGIKRAAREAVRVLRRCLAASDGMGHAARMTVAAIVLSACSLAPAGAADRPNFLVIMTDDIGAESFETHYSNLSNTLDGGQIQTPNINALAAGGVLFNNAYACPLCTPSRVQMLTGQYNYRNNRAFWYLDNVETTFAQRLQADGYATGIAGKWQLSEPDDHSARHDAGYGMGVGVAPTGPSGGKSGRNVTPRVLREQYGFESYLLHALNYTEMGESMGSRYWDPHIETASADGSSSVLVSTTSDDFGPDLYASHLEQFMTDSVAQNKPFLAYMPMNLGHYPFVSTPDSTTTMKDGSDERYFDDMVNYADKLVGQLVDHVDSLGVRQDTVIIFTSDNGTYRTVTINTDERGNVTGEKMYPTEDGTHVPMIVNWQGTIGAGQVSDRPTDLTDVYPTLLELSGAPAGDASILDGKAMVHADGTVDESKDAAYNFYRPLWGSLLNTGGYPPYEKAFAIDRDRIKLYDDGRMYDLQADPDEDMDISASTDPDILQAKARLQSVIDHHAAQREISPRFLNGHVRQVSDTNLDGQGDYLASLVLIVGDNNTDDQEYRTVAEFDLDDVNVASLVANFGSATLAGDITLTKGNVPDVRIVAMSAGEDGTIRTGDFQAAGTELAVLNGLAEGDSFAIDVTDAVLADLLDSQQWTAFRIEATGTAPRDPGADQVRIGGIPGEGIGVETSLRLILGALGDLDLNSLHDADDIDLLAAAIRNGESSAKFDLDRDGQPADQADLDYLVGTILGTLHGDLDLDGQVSFLEAATTVANIGMSDAGWVDGDLDADGLVTLADAQLAVDNYTLVHGTTPPSLTVPEPATLVLLALATPLVTRRRGSAGSDSRTTHERTG